MLLWCALISHPLSPGKQHLTSCRILYTCKWWKCPASDKSFGFNVGQWKLMLRTFGRNLAIPMAFSSFSKDSLLSGFSFLPPMGGFTSVMLLIFSSSVMSNSENVSDTSSHAMPSSQRGLTKESSIWAKRNVFESAPSEKKRHLSIQFLEKMYKLQLYWSSKKKTSHNMPVHSVRICKFSAEGMPSISLANNCFGTSKISPQKACEKWFHVKKALVQCMGFSIQLLEGATDQIRKRSCKSWVTGIHNFKLDNVSPCTASSATLSSPYAPRALSKHATAILQGPGGQGRTPCVRQKYLSKFQMVLQTALGKALKLPNGKSSPQIFLRGVSEPPINGHQADTTFCVGTVFLPCFWCPVKLAKPQHSWNAQICEFLCVPRNVVKNQAVDIPNLDQLISPRNHSFRCQQRRSLPVLRIHWWLRFALQATSDPRMNRPSSRALSSFLATIPDPKCREPVIKPERFLLLSENSGTPKSSILIGFSIINHPFWGTTIFGNTYGAFRKQNPVEIWFITWNQGELYLPGPSKGCQMVLRGVN